MNALSVTEWVRAYVLDRPLKESIYIVDRTYGPEGAVICSDIFHERVVAHSTEFALHALTQALSPNIEATDYYLGLVDSAKPYAEAAIYYTRLGPDSHSWLAVITENAGTLLEVRLFASVITASAWITSVMLLGEKAQQPIIWKVMRTSIQ